MAHGSGIITDRSLLLLPAWGSIRWGVPLCLSWSPIYQVPTPKVPGWFSVFWGPPWFIAVFILGYPTRLGPRVPRARTGNGSPITAVIEFSEVTSNEPKSWGALCPTRRRCCRLPEAYVPLGSQLERWRLGATGGGTPPPRQRPSSANDKGPLGSQKGLSAPFPGPCGEGGARVSACTDATALTVGCSRYVADSEGVRGGGGLMVSVWPLLLCSRMLEHGGPWTCSWTACGTCAGPVGGGVGRAVSRPAIRHRLRVCCYCRSLGCLSKSQGALPPARMGFRGSPGTSVLLDRP